MADEVDVSGSQRFFVDGGCSNGAHSASIGKGNGFFNISKGRLTAHAVDFAIFEFCHIYVIQINEVQNAGAEIAVFGFCDHMNGNICTSDFDGFVDDFFITNDNAFSGIENFLRCNRFYDNFGTNARRISKRDRNSRFLFMEIPLFPFVFSLNVKFFFQIGNAAVDGIPFTLTAAFCDDMDACEWTCQELTVGSQRQYFVRQG